MILFILLPWCAFWLIWRLWTLWGQCWRSAFLAAHVVCGVLIVLSTETLGAIHGLNLAALILFWGAVCVLAVVLLRKYPEAFRLSFPRMDLLIWDKVALGAGLFIVCVVALIALVAPPNTFDAMTYHMSRVAHWLQNASVDNYPTNIPRQLLYLPYAEYAILHAQILTASDRFANLVQWSAMVGSVIGISLIARSLGLKRDGQILSALFVLTVPMSILQGSSTQNDYVVTLWLVCCAVFLLRLGREWSRNGASLTALSFGLGATTKGMGVIMGVPLLLLSLVFFKERFSRKAALLGLTLVATLVMSAAFLGRCHVIVEDPVTAQAMTGAVAVEKPVISAVLSNAVRNVATQLAGPWDGWNRAVERGVEAFHRVLGLDPADKNTTTSADKFTLSYEVDEDVAPNCLHMILILVAGVLFWFVRPKERLLWFYALSVVLGFLVFCATVKWQPWISRFHLTLFVLLAPAVIAILSRSWPRKAVAAILLVLVLASVSALFWNSTRRVWSNKSMFRSTRAALYFERDRSAYVVYKKVAEAMTAMDCRDIGLQTSSDGWEYPWWPMLGWPGRSFRIEAVGVNNATSRQPYPRGAFHPCAIIADGVDNMPSVLVEAGRPYVRVTGAGICTIYVDALRLKRP